MDNAADRIKLAEWISGPIWEAYISPINHPELIVLPDPFTDANDDYAVLEFMRKIHRPEVSTTSDQWASWDRFVVNLPECLVDDYQIGDYARAVLKGGLA